MAATTWRDRKKALWPLALVMPLLPFAAVALFSWSGWALWLWLGPIVILGVVPIIDLVTGEDLSSPPDDVIPELERRRYYRAITYAFIPLQLAGFVFAFWFIASGGMSVMERIGLAVTVGFIGGLGINTAHELGHKKEQVERWASKVALAQSGYGHFYIEHNRGHHVRVATPQDPASSRLGESFYAFWPRTVFGSLRSAWGLERMRLARRGKSPLSLGNDLVNAWVMTLVLWVAMIAWLGVTIVPFLLLQAFVAITLLEAVNYLEHYGMLRARVRTGDRERYERVNPTHSWNSNHIATNVLLYHLQRHSDHHALPARRYQALRDDRSAPSLPTGYGGMIVLALVPPLWRRVMDPRVAAHVGGDLSRANLTPRRQRAMAMSTPMAVRADVFTVQAGTGPTWSCSSCGYRYDERTGEPREGFDPGTAWASIPETWCCPDCGVREKVDFVRVDA